MRKTRFQVAMATAPNNGRMRKTFIFVLAKTADDAIAAAKADASNAAYQLFQARPA